MTSTAAAPVTGAHRLLDPASGRGHEALPRPSLPDLLEAIERSGLTGRGGAGFPTLRKVRAVAGGRRRPVVVGNAMEGEPLSGKDAVLLARNPGLVLDGLEILGRAMHARRVILAAHRDILAAHRDVGRHELVAAIAGRRVELAQLSGGFVSGQETAVVNQLNGRPALPGDQFRRVSESGVDGRPTLVLNAETLAHVALIVRHGAEGFRSAGRPDDPGTSLFTISGSVERPGVVEAPRGTRLADVLASARPQEPVAVLVGGYHGAWVPGTDLDVPLTKFALAPYAASVGAGVLHVLGPGTCPLELASRVVDYLATESARQCGPCVNGLPHLASDMRRLAAGARDALLPGDIDRMARVVSGRGACAHPDGSARFVVSTLDVFADHVAAHLRGECPNDPETRR
jgi:NADH:ubiquinone oxidoreductase subunit F (NADH-binding)